MLLGKLLVLKIAKYWTNNLVTLLVIKVTLKGTSFGQTELFSQLWPNFHEHNLFFLSFLRSCELFDRYSLSVCDPHLFPY